MKITDRVPAGVLLRAGVAMVRAGGPERLDKVPSRFAKMGDTKVHYKSVGEGKKALVLVHGWSSDLTFFSGQVPALDGKALRGIHGEELPGVRLVAAYCDGAGCVLAQSGGQGR